MFFMTTIYKLTLATILFIMVDLLVLGCRKAVSSPEGMKQSEKILNQYIEKVRKSRYWLQRSQEDDSYIEGRTVSALYFWSNNTARLKAGLCVPELNLCIANFSDPEARSIAEIKITQELSLQNAFLSFAKANYGDGDAWFPSLNLADFVFEEKIITLPHLGLPASIINQTVPQTGLQEAERLWQESKNSLCWSVGKTRPSGCTGKVIYAYYDEDDSRWYTLRTCSSECDPEYRGDSVQILFRGERGEWISTVGGYTNSLKDIDWYKSRIEKAAMFQFELK